MSAELSPDLLTQLRADLSARWARGERARVEDYLDSHPELAASPAGVVELVYAELLLREANGDEPTLEEYLARFPRHAGAIEQQWRVHRLVRTGGLQSLHDGSLTPEERTEPYAPGTARDKGALPGLVLLGEIGRGGMGVVYRARQTDLDGRLVAVKMMQAQLADHQPLAERFRTEARAVGRLAHPGIVPVFAFGESDTTLFLVMEYVPGGSLAKRLRQGPLSPQEAAALVAKLARAVQAAHDAKVLHRDLKPGNVLLTADGQPKITDFGLAKLLDAETQTKTGTPMGTPAYMAPEQISGLERAGPAADLWSLGVILYECLTGRRPFEGADKYDTLRAIRKDNPPPPCEGPLAAICLACLRKRPQERYASAAALADDLERWLAGQGVQPPRRRWSRRAVLAAGGGLVVGGLALGLALRERPTARPPRTPREEVEARLREGLAYEWKGDEPLPGPFRLLLGTGPPVASPNEPALTVETLGLALVELVVPPCPRYVFSAQTRHDAAEGASEVGLYFAYRQAVAANGRRQAAVFYLSFDERSRRAQAARDKAGRRQSYVGLASNLVEERPGRVPHISRGGVPGVQLAFEPSQALAKMGPWRALRLRVTPEEVAAYWDQEGKGPRLIGKMRQRDLEEHLQAAKEDAVAEPGQFNALPVAFTSVAGLGLYVRAGKASFQELRVTPLGAGD